MNSQNDKEDKRPASILLGIIERSSSPLKAWGAALVDEEKYLSLLVILHF